MRMSPRGIRLNLNVAINTASIGVKLGSMTNWFVEMRAQRDTPPKWFEVITSNQVIDGSKSGIAYSVTDYTQ